MVKDCLQSWRSLDLEHMPIWNTCRFGTHADLEHFAKNVPHRHMFQIGKCSISVFFPQKCSKSVFFRRKIFIFESVPNPSISVRSVPNRYFFNKKNKQKSAKKFNVFLDPRPRLLKNISEKLIEAVFSKATILRYHCLY